MLNYGIVVVKEAVLMDVLLIVWIVLGIVFVIVEALTVQIVTIWFAIGSVGAIVANIFKASPAVQLAIFIAVSAITLAVARPILKKCTKTTAQPTNADMLIGKTATVTEDFCGEEFRGRVKINGADWTAKSIDGKPIKNGGTVLIEAIEGVTLLVKQKEEE